MALPRRQLQLLQQQQHVCIMVGHDDDVVLDPKLYASRPRTAKSSWEGKQSDVAIAESMIAQFPQLRATYARTNEDLLATDAKVRAPSQRLRAASHAHPASEAHMWAGGAGALLSHASLVRMVLRVL